MTRATNLGAQIRARRTELGLSLRDVEKSTAGRISNSYLCQLEGGQIENPSFPIILHLAAALLVTVDTMAEWLEAEPAELEFCPTCGQILPAPQ